MPDTIRRFLQSRDFFKSLILVTGVLAPVSLFYTLGHTSVGISIATGVFLCSFSDVPGSRRHRLLGIAIATVLAALTTLGIHLTLPYNWLLVPALALLVLANAVLAVYGFRASLVAFSGLLAIVFAFARPLEGAAMWRHAGLIVAGGGWYLALSSAAFHLTARRRNLRQLAECMRLTAQYLRLRAGAPAGPGEEVKRQDRLFQLQRDLNALHEQLREIFLSDRIRSGASSSANRPLLILIELIDILELALAEQADYRRARRDPAADGEIDRLFEELSAALSDRLHELAEALDNKRRPPPDDRLAPLFAGAEEKIRAALAAEEPRAAQSAVSRQNRLAYVLKQRHKIRSIERVLENMAAQARLVLENKTARRFITGQDYDLRVLRQNLNARSPIFRHALRLTLTVLAGYGLGSLLTVQNAYWIMLTVMVIMRPNYGLTKERSRQRLTGTLIGGLIAAGVVVLTHNLVVYGVLAVVCLVLAQSLVQKNYGAAAVFITLSIVFLYALSTPDAFSVIQYRIVDTALGAALSFLAGLFLWPVWEIAGIRTQFADTIRANAAYLREISDYYGTKGELPAFYKLARKEAFLANGDLTAAFQRMTQEPKRKRRKLSETYELVVLNHTFLQAAAALGAFIQHHPTTERSTHFETFIDGTLALLREAEAVLRGEPAAAPEPAEQVEAAEKYMADRLAELAAAPAAGSTRTGVVPEVLPRLQEARLVLDQLRWMYDIAGNVREGVVKLDGEG